MTGAGVKASTFLYGLNTKQTLEKSGVFLLAKMKWL